MPIRFLSLFAGVGGFDLGLERASWECAGQVEIDPFCQKVLAKHWPNVWRYDDVRSLTGELVREHCGRVDAIVGGVPCQPASVAGKRKGTADDRWLWPDFLRLVSEVRPLWVLAENPRGVLSIDIAGVPFGVWLSGEFAARDYELLPVKLAAEDVGAPHRRERIFFVALANGGRSGSSRRDAIHEGRRTGDDRATSVQASTGWSFGTAIGNAESTGGNDKLGDALRGRFGINESGQSGQIAAARCADVADTGNARLERQWYGAISAGETLACAPRVGGYQWPARPGQSQYDWEEPRTTQLQVGESASGVSERLVRRHRVNALKALGNAIVPQVAEIIGRAILEMEGR